MSEKIVYESEARGGVQRDERAPTRGLSGRAPTPGNGPRLTRRRRTQDILYFDPRIVPPGMSYEWKRDSGVFGAPDSAHMTNLRENHWVPVPGARHPELALNGDTLIRRGDVTLCERPKYLTEEATMEDIHEAMGPIQRMEEVMYGTQPGHMTRDHPSVKQQSYVRQQYSPGTPITEGSEDGGMVADP